MAKVANSFDDPANNPFLHAAQNLKTEHTGPPMKEKNFIDGATPLHKAAALLKLEKVDELLMTPGTNLDAEDVLLQTPLILMARLHYAKADVPKAVQMTQKLLDAGASLVTDEGVIIRDAYGDSLLTLAAMASAKNGPSILRTLVDALPSDSKAKLCQSRCKNFGNTPLHWAIISDDIEACQLLVDSGMSLERKNRENETVLAYCDKYDKPKIKAIIEKAMKK